MTSAPKVVVLAGGRGTRLSEEPDLKPKPMVEIGDRPILWHILKHYAAYGCKEFYVALGYKGHVIKRYFLDEVQLAGDLTVRLARPGQRLLALNGHEYELDAEVTAIADEGGVQSLGGVR